MGEEDRVALSLGGDANIVFGFGGEGFYDEVVEGSGDRFDLYGLLVLGTRTMRCS